MNEEKNELRTTNNIVEARIVSYSYAHRINSSKIYHKYNYFRIRLIATQLVIVVRKERKTLVLIIQEFSNLAI